MIRSSASTLLARSVSVAVATSCLCAAAQGQVARLEQKQVVQPELLPTQMELEKKLKYEPNLMPIRSLNEAPPPTALQSEHLKPDFLAIGAGVVNDDCVDAIDVGALPALVFGDTFSATPDAVDFCGTSITAPGVWYTVTGTGTDLNASLCGFADYDTKLSVYEGDCSALVCVAGNDDFCGLISDVSWCSTPGTTYFILVHGFSSNVGFFDLAVTDLGTACGPCVLACDPGAIPEGEPTCTDDYDDTFNGGCLSTVPVYSDIACGETVCGEAGTFLSGGFDTRDTDWYQLDLAVSTIVTWEAAGEFPILVGIADNGGNPDCGVFNFEFLTSATADSCETASISATLTPGTWWLWVSPADFSGVPCGSTYQATVTCADPPTGAACVGDAGGSCVDNITEAEANALGYIYQGDGTNCGDVTCPLPPENDLCENADVIPVPSLTFASTFLSTIDDVPFCGTAATSPGVWYRVAGTGNTITASLCGSTTQYDSKISVYCGDCTDLNCVTGIDDFCGLQSEVSFCSQVGADYLILVHGFGGQSGEFELDVYDDGVACVASVGCLPAGACCGAVFTACTHTVQMFDSFGDGWDGATMNVLVNGVTVLSGISASGSGSSETFSADTDDVITTVYTAGNFESEHSYQILDGFGAIIGSDGPSPSPGINAVASCVEPSGCEHTVDMFDSFGDGWDGATMDVLVNGSPVLFGISASGSGSSETFFAETGDVIDTVYTSGSFESEHSYQIVDGAGNVIGADGPSPGPGINAVAFCPAGRVNGSGCLVLTEDECIAAGGAYQGDDTDCGVINYDVDLTYDNVIDISGSGTPLGLGDDDGAVVPIGFTFNFYGNDYTDIGVCSNGYLTFGDDLSDFSNDPIPDTFDPNDLIAVMWDDLNPSSGGEVFYDTLGVAPNRTFIAMWLQVPQFGNTDQNTFEAILYEGSNRVEYRYFSITPQAFAGDYTMGVENADGTVGRSIDPDWAGDGGIGFGYNQDPANDPCNNGADITTQGAAPGDSTYGWGDGIVTAADINFYINAWIAGDLGYGDVTTQGAGPGHPLYSAEDGVVTAADINYFVNQWVQRTP